MYPHRRVGLLKTNAFYLRDELLLLPVIYFRVKEEVFWRNYFYRVSLIKQSAQLTALAAHQAAERREVGNTGTNPEDVQNGKSVVPVIKMNVIKL